MLLKRKSLWDDVDEFPNMHELVVWMVYADCLMFYIQLHTPNYTSWYCIMVPLTVAKPSLHGTVKLLGMDIRIDGWWLKVQTSMDDHPLRIRYFIIHQYFIIYPRGSMYGIYANIYLQYTPNVSIYMDPMGIYIYIFIINITLWLWLTVCHGKIHHAINR